MDQGRDQSVLRILSYNIAGLQNKLIYPGFFSYVKNFDLFCLYETHVVEEKYSSFTKYFGGFRLCWVGATRSSQYGRASGGILLGIKLELFSKGTLKFMSLNGLPYIQLVQKTEVINYFPAYVNCNNWEIEFNKFIDLFNEIELTNIVILGDFNVRIGQLQNLPEELETGPFIDSCRRSQDLVVNCRGRRFLDFCSDLGLAILNGRTEGDSEGRYTCVTGSGASVNDIAAISYSLCPFIRSLEIDEQIFSDHFPLKLTWILVYTQQSVISEPLKLLPKLNWKIQNPESYRANLSYYCNANGSNNSVEGLVEIIKRSAVTATPRKAVYIQKWFDNSCLRARQLSFKWLNLYRKTASSLARENYLIYNKSFKALCKTKREQYNKEIIAKLGAVRDSKSWWNLAKEIGGKKFITGAALSLDSLKQHFESMLNPSLNHHTILYAAPLVHDSILDVHFELDELRFVLNKMQDNKAPGIDRVPYEFYKHAPDDFLVNLLECYNRIYDNLDLPESFLNSVIFPIHKKGDVNSAENYRGLSFIDTVAKLFVGILYNRASLWEKEHRIICESQAGFRTGYSAIDNVFNLVNSIKLCHSVNIKKVYAFFVDFKSAFDTINRNSLFYKLYNLGMSTKFIQVIQKMYCNNQAQVWNGEALSESFFSTSGVRQGCILSPLLFSLFINDLESALEMGITIEDIHLNVLMYADDIVILSDSPNKLQRMINQLEEYCKMWDLVVNLDKSKIIIFQRGGGKRRDDENWTFNNRAVDVVKEYTYLGITLTPKISMATNLKNRLESAKVSINISWGNFFRNRNTKHSDKLKLFDAVSKSILCYGAQIWGYQEFELVEKLQRFFIKKIFKLPQHTPNYMVTLETGLPCIYIYTLRCHFEYLARVLYKFGDDRLPHRLAQKVVEKNIYWFCEWKELAEKHNINLYIGQETYSSIKVIFAELIKKEEEWLRNRAINLARSTVRHELYNKLHYYSEQSYIKDCFSTEKINLIWRYRGGLILLNGSPWRRQGSSMCSLCNLNEEETLLHYLGRCPVLSEFRVQAFGKRVLGESDIVATLNGGNNFDDLFIFATKAWKYRKFLINEYND